MKTLTVTEQDMLAKALSHQFEEPITGYLFDVKILDGVAHGNVFNHARACSETGRFADGHYIVTSDIMGIGKEQNYWIIKTRNSVYLVVSLAEEGKAAFAILQAKIDGSFHKPSKSLH